MLHYIKIFGECQYLGDFFLFFFDYEAPRDAAASPGDE
jgi:hypothetical protein